MLIVSRLIIILTGYALRVITVKLMFVLVMIAIFEVYYLCSVISCRFITTQRKDSIPGLIINTIKKYPVEYGPDPDDIHGFVRELISGAYVVFGDAGDLYTRIRRSRIRKFARTSSHYSSDIELCIQTEYGALLLGRTKKGNTWIQFENTARSSRSTIFGKPRRPSLRDTEYDWDPDEIERLVANGRDVGRIEDHHHDLIDYFILYRLILNQQYNVGRYGISRYTEKGYRLARRNKEKK